MKGSYHTWTMPQVRFVAALWHQNLTCVQIAERVVAQYGIKCTKGSIVTLARVHRTLMPMKTREQRAVLRAASDARRAA